MISELPVGFAYASACILGFPIGVFAGQFLKSVLSYWESTETSINALRSVLTLVLGLGGAGATWWIFSSTDVTILYMGALGVGLSVAIFLPVPQRTLVKASAESLQANDRITHELPDADRQFLTLVMTWPDDVPEGLGMTEEQMNRELGRILDDLSALQDESCDELLAQSVEFPDRPPEVDGDD